MSTVEVPLPILRRALRKARIQYVKAVERDHPEGDPGPAWECWAEFEALASYVPGWPLEEAQDAS
jgi:hypothetical protein